MPKTIEQAKRVMAAASPEAARLLGAGVSRPCAQARYNNAAAAALADPDAGLTRPERELIASFIEGNGTPPREYMLRVRLTESEHNALDDMARRAGLDMSEYVREQLFTER